MNVIILAAGKGTRMKSDKAKVLHELAGKPLIQHVLDRVYRLKNPNVIVVVGYQKEAVQKVIQKYPVKISEQREQLGTGHAVQQGFSQLDLNQPETLILCGDVPLISGDTILKLNHEHQQTQAKATVLTAELKDPASYGRIVRGETGEVLKIVEFKDAPEAIKNIREINSGTYFFDTQALIEAVKQLKSENAQKEFYLTDTLEIIRNSGERVSAYCLENSNEILGVNTEEDLRAMEKLVSVAN